MKIKTRYIQLRNRSPILMINTETVICAEKNELFHAIKICQIPRKWYLTNVNAIVEVKI